MMKLWALLGFFTAASVPWAAAAVEPDGCQAARASPAERIAPSARLLDGDRNVGGGLSAVREGAAARPAVADRRDTELAIDHRARRPKPRKRIDTQVPDAVLIGRGGAL